MTQKTKGRTERHDPKQNDSRDSINADPVAGWYSLGKTSRMNRQQKRTMRNIASGTHAHTPNAPRFTLGPWRRLSQRVIVADHGAELPICEVWSGGVGIEQADANQRLLVAAPDLFAALTAIVADCAGVGPDSDGYYLVHDLSIEQARAALRIAQEGRK